jgi:hypothetical protein
VNRKGFHPAVSVAADLTICGLILLVAALELIVGSQGYETYRDFVNAAGGLAVAVG